MDEKQTSREQATRRIAAMLALAEDAAKRGDENERDACLAKASAMQHKFSIEDVAASGKVGPEEITYAEFCTESNTPLIKVKRELIRVIAGLFRGRTVMVSKFDPAKAKMNKRAAIGVYAHESDLAFIQQMYTSLLVQMQRMMANDEKKYQAPVLCTNLPWCGSDNTVAAEQYPEEYRGDGSHYCQACMEWFTPDPGKKVRGRNGVPNSWRVSYGFGWVDTVNWRLWEAYRKNAAEAEVRTPGSELVVRDKKMAVDKFIEDMFPGKPVRMAPRQDRDIDGRRNGADAARRADLGQTRVTDGARPQLGA